MGTRELQEVIVEWENGNDRPFQKLYRKLYDKTFPSIKNLTKSSIQAEDAFMEGLYIFLEHFFIGKRTLPENIFNYFYRMCYNIWYDSHLKQKYSPIFNDQLKVQDAEYPELESQVPHNHLKQVALAKAIERLEGLCKKIFQLHIEDGKKLKNLWSELGFKNYQSLVQTNYRCKKKLTQIVLEEYEILVEQL